MLNRILFLCVLLLPLSSFAGGVYVGQFQPFFNSGTLYLIPIAADISNKPVCANRVYMRLPDAVGSPEFNAKFSIILSSWMAKKDLRITGTGGCTSEGDEVVASILMQYST